MEISDEEWRMIYPILATHKLIRVRCEKQCRSFLVAVLWILRGGMPWRTELFKIVVASTRNFVFFKQPFRTALDSGRPRSG